MKKFLGEFKEFALRGNVIDLAVGVIVGAAFKAIVDSLVNDVLSPVLGLLVKVDFSDLVYAVPNTEVNIAYGAFIMTVINFIIMAFFVFCFVKFINKLSNLKKKEVVEEEPTTKKCPYCCSEISIDAVKCPHCTSDVEQVQ